MNKTNSYILYISAEQYWYFHTQYNIKNLILQYDYIIDMP